MNLLITILVLLFCLLISNIVSHYIPSIPTALTQIGIGVVLAFVLTNASFEIEAEWFLLLFVAPLLYNDGRYFSRAELWEMRLPILGNAIILVILTTIGGGYFINWIIPSIPLAAAFALAAILSPTDPVAVNGIAKRIQIPQKVLSLVRGESLINDASGLVAFNYAIAAVVTGYFSLSEAITEFSYKFLAGVILGVVLGFLVTWTRFILRKQGIIDVTFHSLLQILAPFLIYIIAEDLLHASGVIAVVAAGIVHSLVQERTETMVAEEQVLTENIWSIITFILNGLVFLLLGLNIPSSISGAVADPTIDNWLLIGYVISTGIVILGIRFTWSWLFFYSDYHYGKAKNALKPDLRTNLLISLTGVRGAVTMAGILSTPHFLANGTEFPQRFTILFIAAGIILFTLIIAVIFLPILSKRNEKDAIPSVSDLNNAKRKIILESIKRIKHEMNEENKTAAYELIDEYKARFKQLQTKQNMQGKNNFQQKSDELRLMALTEERRYIHKALDEEKISVAELEILEKILDQREEILSTNIRAGLKYLIGRLFRNWKHNRGYFANEKGKVKFSKSRLVKEIQLKSLQAAYKFLEEYRTGHENTHIVYVVMHEYKKMMDRFNEPGKKNNVEKQEQKEDLRIKIMDLERSQIREMFETGELTREQAKELRRFVNNIESIILHEYVE